MVIWWSLWFPMITQEAQTLLFLAHVVFNAEVVLDLIMLRTDQLFRLLRVIQQTHYHFVHRELVHILEVSVGNLVLGTIKSLEIVELEGNALLAGGVAALGENAGDSLNSIKFLLAFQTFEVIHYKGL